MGIQSHNLNLNQTYFFAFQADLNQLNGLYKVQAILQNDEVEAFLEDPVQQLYALVNKLDIYDNKLKAKYREEVHYKLQSIETDKVYYFPDSLIVSFPLADFKKVMEYMVTLQFGAIDDPDELESLSLELCKLSRRFTGIVPTLTIATYGEKYLTEDAINDYNHSRKVYKSPDPLKEITDDLTEENIKLRRMIAKYEKIILDYEAHKNKLTNLVKLIVPSP